MVLAKTAKKPAAKKPAAKKPAAKKPAAKKPAAKKPAAKKPAVKKPTVAEFGKALPAWQRQVFEELASLVKKAAPKASVSIKWAQPVFEANGPIAFIKPARAHLTFGFWRGAELDDPLGILDGSGERMKHVKIAEGEAIPLTLLSKMIVQAVKLNAAQGDPTKRR